MPKQMTSTRRGGRSRCSSGQCAIIFVVGVMPVMPMPLTSSRRAIPWPSLITVAVWSRRTTAST